MPNEKTTSDPGGQQPEALASLQAAAKAGSKKPADQGLRAGAETKPAPEGLEKEETEAAAILARNAANDTGQR